MRELRILTLQLDSRTGLFDDRPLRGYLANREILKTKTAFFTHDGQPMWTVYVESRALTGQPPDSTAATTAQHPTPRRLPRAPPMRAALAAVDEITQARYRRLTDWRRRTALREGVPSYVLLTNRQTLDLAAAAPATVAGLREIKGIGVKRAAKHGRALLEVLHGPQPTTDEKRGAGLRAVDGDDVLAAGADGALPEAAAGVADAADRGLSDRAAGAVDDGELAARQAVDLVRSEHDT